MLDELEAVGEEEGEGGHHGGAALVEAAGGETGHVEDRFGWGGGGGRGGCHGGWNDLAFVW